MDWELAARRQGVAEWRDRQILSALALFNSKAKESLEAFEAQAATASVVDSVWDPSGFADARVDALMCERMDPALKEFMSAAETELVALSDGFADLGAALARSEAVVLPEPTEPEPAPETDAAAPVATAGTDEGAGSWITRLPWTAAKHASSLARSASETAEWIVQDKVGARDRLRLAAGNRLAMHWMGGVGEPRPVLAQVITIIDEVAHQARTSSL